VEGVSLKLLDPDSFGGWRKANTATEYRREPVKPVIFPEEKTSYMASLGDKGLCLTEFIEYQGIPNRGKKGDPRNMVFRGFDSWEIVRTGDYGQVFVYAPYKAYQIPVIQILVPVELVDTWVWRPTISDLRIIDVKWSDGSTYAEISGSKVFYVTVLQRSSVTSTGRIEVEASTPYASIYPEYQEATLAPGEPKTFRFTLTNLGPETDVTGYVTVKTYDEFTGDLKDSDSSLRFKLLAFAPEYTTLNVYVYDDETDDPIPDAEVVLHIQGGETYTQYTDEDGYASFNLGTFTGTVTLKVSKEGYQTQTRTLKLAGGVTEVVFYLSTKPAGIPAWLIATIAVSASIIVAALIIYWRRR